jgi:hypothetical protein
MKNLKSNLSSEKFWLRLLFMLMFFFCVKLANFLIGILIFTQFIYRLFNNTDQKKISSFSASLVRFVFQCHRFLTYQSETKPYPFSAWPEEP